MGGYRQYQVKTGSLATIGAVVTSIGWFTPLSEPVRIDPAAAPYGQCFTGAGHTEAIRTNWLSQLSEPVRIEPGLSAAWMQYYSAPLVPSTSDLRNRWFSPLSEPVRIKKAVAWQQPFATDWRLYPPVGGWFSQLSEPVKLEPGLSAAWTQNFAAPAVPAVAFTTFWYSPLSEPVRIDPAAAPYGQCFTGAGVPTVAFATFWYSPLSEPVRIEPGLSAAWTQYYAWPQVPVAAVTADSWFKWFSEPVRIKKAVVWQQPYATDWKIPVARQDSWFKWFSEPVRWKRAVPWQQFFASHVSPVPVAPIDFILSVTETGDTGAFLFDTQSLLIGGNVTITEIRVGDLAVATVTETEVKANVTITEIPVGNLAWVTITELD